MSNIAPPWVLFVDQGKPVAILPAGRPGEVAKVGHLTMKEARQIVRLGNRLHDVLVDARLKELRSLLDAFGAQIDAIRLGTGAK